jgi:hypothetical protein
VRPHERSYVEHLLKAGLDVVRIDGVEVTNTAIDQTLAAMQRGVPVIVQAALSHQGWNGRADILRRVEVPSTLGGWSYEPIDTKLARDTKAGTILQLCHYADLLTKTQRLPPEYMYVVAPWSEFEPQQYRFADYAAYFRQVKKRLKRPWLPRMNAPAHQLSVFVRRWLSVFASHGQLPPWSHPWRTGSTRSNTCCGRTRAGATRNRAQPRAITAAEGNTLRVNRASGRVLPKQFKVVIR